MGVFDNPMPPNGYKPPKSRKDIQMDTLNGGAQEPMAKPKDPILEVLDFQASPPTSFEKVHMLCPQCGWHGLWSDCELEWESDGWETPEYKVAVCPICGHTVDYN